MSAVGEILDKNGQSLVRDLQQSMADKRLNASGETSRSITYEVEETLTKSTLIIKANRSIGALQYGRRAGGWPPRNVIRQWIDDKAINPGEISKDSLAFLIQRKIGTLGIKVPNRFNPGGVISDVITDDRIDKIFKEVKVASVNRLVEATRKVKGGFEK